jgi:hypothetical protein
MARILFPTKPGILTRFILGIELFAVGMAAISILSTSAKYLFCETNTEKKFQKLKIPVRALVRMVVESSEQNVGPPDIVWNVVSIEHIYSWLP